MRRLSAEAMVMSQPIQKREFVTGIFQFPEWMRYRLELVFQLTVSGTPAGVGRGPELCQICTPCADPERHRK
jgi:hypothetical protein